MGSLEPIKVGALDRRRNNERRKDERLSGRGAAVSVAHGEGVDPALCGDVSPSGARLALDRPLAVGELVTVDFGPGMTLQGRVAWVENAECGIEFDRVEGEVPAPSDVHPQTVLTVRGPGQKFRQGLRVKVMLPDSERKAVLRWTDDDCATITLQS